MLDHVDLPRLQALTDNWLETPPIHFMLAAYFDIKPKTKTIESTASQDENASELLMQFPQDPMTLPKGDLSIGCRHIRAKNE